ncbi:hypothetical protein LR48_Vigan683s000500 [Vigna angularis]|uniref:Uncharacterized protein n=1 Tax=Phaseolus angularis TaxID=3914 RepID=A0A0L9TG49_PHAAN|nr:hypothetical protein LR48_Vigan683s000500 [Vigna angularis]
MQQKEVLQLQTHDALLAQNKILTQQLETLTKTLAQLPKELKTAAQAVSPLGERYLVLPSLLLETIRSYLPIVQQVCDITFWTVNGWFFRDELPVRSTPTPVADHTTFIPQSDFEKYVVDQFRKKCERDERVEDTLFRWEKKGNKNGIGFETEDSNDESTDED